METLQLPPQFSNSKIQLSHCKNLTISLYCMQIAGVMTDVTLICRRNEEVKAHRVVLAAASHYFRTGAAVFLLLNFDIDEVQSLMYFLYTGRLTNDIVNDTDALKRLMEVGRHVDVQLLVAACLHRLADTLDITNYMELHNLAKEHKVPEVTDRIDVFIALNLSDMIASNEITAWDLDMLKNILLNPELLNIPLDTICAGILKWTEAVPDRNENLHQLMQLIDVSRLSDTFLAAFIRNETIKNDVHVLVLMNAESTTRLTRRLEMVEVQNNPAARLYQFLKDVLQKLSRLTFRAIRR